MPKRKYATFSDPMTPNPTYECTKRKCKWQGTQEQKVQAPMKDDPAWKEDVCPDCGNNEFYRLLNT